MPRAILFVLLCQGLWAQNQQAADPSTLGRVEGRVLNAVTNEPLRKAQLRLRGTTGSEYAATSDASGHFVIERVVPGSYTLAAEHQNFLSEGAGTDRGPRAPAKSFSLSSGQSLADIEIKLTPLGVISGKVVDQDGEPVVSVPVTVMRWSFVRGGRQLQPAGAGAQTNDRGEYRIFNLQAGRYYLVVNPGRYEVFGQDGVPSGPAPETVVMTYYPSAPDASTAVPVALAAGQEVPGTDIRLRSSRTFTVKGKLAGFQAGHRYGVILMQQEMLTSSNMGAQRMGNVAPEDGTFTIRGVPPGRYNLTVTADSRTGTHQELTVGDGDLQGVVVTLQEPGSVKGKVQTLASGTGTSPLGRLRISLQPLSTFSRSSPNVATASDGSFTIDDVAADRYRVYCSPVQGTYLKTIRWAGQLSTDGIVEMTAGSTPTLDLLFAPTTAQIDGDVKGADDQPVARANVLLIPASLKESDFRMTLTDEKGHFSAKAVAPGNYVALATDAMIFNMPDPAFLKALEKVTTAVNVDENGHATASLKIVPASVIEDIP